MGDVVNINDFKRLKAAMSGSSRVAWREVFTVDDACSTLQVYANADTGEVELVQSDDGNTVTRTTVNPAAAMMLADVLRLAVARYGPTKE